MVCVIPSALPQESLLGLRGARFGKRMLAMKTADRRYESESSTNAVLFPYFPFTTPPIAAPIVSIADQVTEDIAFAGNSSLSETIDGTAAVRAGSKNVEKINCSTVST